MFWEEENKIYGSTPFCFFVSETKFLASDFSLAELNKVDDSRRAEKCRSLRVQVEDGVSGCA